MSALGKTLGGAQVGIIQRTLDFARAFAEEGATLEL
jgi:hypothetical protein